MSPLRGFTIRNFKGLSEKIIRIVVPEERYFDCKVLIITQIPYG